MGTRMVNAVRRSGRDTDAHVHAAKRALKCRERERERERDLDGDDEVKGEGARMRWSVYMCIYIERGRERDSSPS